MVPKACFVCLFDVLHIYNQQFPATNLTRQVLGDMVPRQMSHHEPGTSYSRNYYRLYRVLLAMHSSPSVVAFFSIFNGFPDTSKAIGTSGSVGPRARLSSCCIYTHMHETAAEACSMQYLPVLTHAGPQPSTVEKVLA